jgi:ceramide glucosyltransferase
MEWYHYIAILFMAAQGLYCTVCYRNYRFVKSKGRKERGFIGRAVLVVPCKGIDQEFEKNIKSFYTQDYEDYSLWFVVGDDSDPAHAELKRIQAEMAGKTAAKDVQVLVAGTTQGCSQKLHNLLHACRRMGKDVVAMAFADSDICVRNDWLAHIVHPLRRPGLCGVASGYRLFIPARMNTATLALASMNAAVAQMLGPYGFNHAWGGSMAVRRDVFEELGVEKVWATSISDDLSISRLVQNAHQKIAFVPGCLVASYTSMKWPALFEFARRQFVITRIATPGLWLTGLASSAYSVAGLWGAAALALYARSRGLADWWVPALVAVVFLFGHFCKAWFRQEMMAIVLDDDGEGLKAAKRADVLLSWLWSPLMLALIVSSAFGRTITWRGIRYRLMGPTNVVVLGPEKA